MILAGVQATLDATGIAERTVTPRGARTGWQIERIRATGSGAGIPELTVYQGEVSVNRFLDGTGSGNNDVAEFPNPVQLQPGEFLTLRWEQGTPGGIVSVVVEGQPRSGYGIP